MTSQCFLVLHALRLKGLASEPRIALVTGLHAFEVQSSVNELVSHGWAIQRSGRLAGTMLTPAGRSAHSDLLAARRGNVEQIRDVYDTFLPLNARFKAACCEWQRRPGARQVDRVVAVHEAISGLLERLERLEGRFASYRARFDGAVERLERGHLDALLRPGAESYHEIWMELHQDLLLTLGRTREDEVAAAGVGL